LYGVDIPTANTARHHATPRNGWIEQLRMYDREAGRLTTFGEDVTQALVAGDRYFWISPAKDVLDALRLTDAPSGLMEDDISFHRDATPPDASEAHSVVEGLRETLLAGYGAAKLVHASQASLRLAVEYVSYRSYSDKRLYRWEGIVDTLFQENRELFQRYSARKGKIGFFKVNRA
jgi:hypothetical protein